MNLLKTPIIRDIMRRNGGYMLVLTSLVPILIWSMAVYGARALRLILTALGICLAVHILSCLLFNLVIKRPKMYFDMSFALTALLLSLSFPWNVRYPVLVFSCLVAMLSKELLGGTGKNPLNPALCGRVFAMLVYPEYNRVLPYAYKDAALDPLSAVLKGEIPEQDMLDLFLGRADGMMGQISAVLILCAAVFLIVNKTVKWQAPAAFLLASAVTAVLLAPESTSYVHYMGGHLLSGGLLFAAVYFCSDPVTVPQTPSARLVFGALSGALSVASRIFLGVEGLYIVILVMGLWTPLLDRLFRPGVFGAIKQKKSVQKPLNAEEGS